MGKTKHYEEREMVRRAKRKGKKAVLRRVEVSGVGTVTLLRHPKAVPPNDLDKAMASIVRRIMRDCASGHKPRDRVYCTKGNRGHTRGFVVTCELEPGAVKASNEDEGA